MTFPVIEKLSVGIRGQAVRHSVSDERCQLLQDEIFRDQERKRVIFLPSVSEI